MKKICIFLLLILSFPMLWSYSERLGILLGLVPGNAGRPLINLGLGIALIFYILLSWLLIKLFLQQEVSNKLISIVYLIIGALILTVVSIIIFPIGVVLSDPIGVVQKIVYFYSH